MKQLPDILTSANFWASIATMWAAAGAWGTYIALNDVTNSPFVGSLSSIVRQLVTLNHAIRQLLDSVDRLHAFVMGDVLMYQSVMEKLAPKNSPVEMALSSPPTTISMPRYLNQIAWMPQERAYINIIFMMNEAIHQGVIGGADSPDTCLYKSFRVARGSLQNFKKNLKADPLPRWFWLLHIVAFWLALLGLWEVMRWF